MAGVLTQAPQAPHVGPHGAGHPRTARHDSLSMSTIRPPSSNKARLTEAARVEYVSHRDWGGASATSHLRNIIARDYQYRDALAHPHPAALIGEESKLGVDDVASQPRRSMHMVYRHVNQGKWPLDFLGKRDDEPGRCRQATSPCARG